MPGIDHLLINPFLNITKRSPKRAHALGLFTDNALGLAGQPAEIVALYNAYHPVFEAFHALYIGRGSSGADRHGRTLAQGLLLDELSERIKEWAFQVENVHRRDTPEYQTYLPQGRRPFRHGKIEDRATAVRVLARELAGKPAFSALYADVQAFSDQFEAAIGGAVGGETIEKTKSQELEIGRIALCHALYAVLGGLINLYPDNPHRVTTYFDIATMHRHRHRVRE